MKQEDIDFLTIRLDPKKEYGSVQAILSEGDLRTLSFDSVAKRIIMNLLNDRQAILNENKNMSTYLKKHNLYCEEAVFGEKK